MSDLGLYRALAGGAGLAGCIALLADQARANRIELVPPAPLTFAVQSAPVAQAFQVPLTLNGKAAWIHGQEAARTEGGEDLTDSPS